jgi:hypothetical protein
MENITTLGAPWTIVEYTYWLSDYVIYEDATNIYAACFWPFNFNSNPQAFTIIVDKLLWTIIIWWQTNINPSIIWDTLISAYYESWVIYLNMQLFWYSSYCVEAYTIATDTWVQTSWWTTAVRHVTWTLLPNWPKVLSDWKTFTLGITSVVTNNANPKIYQVTII